MASEPTTEQDGPSEVAVLRDRIRALEMELAQRSEAANAALVAAQERVYWLDRLRLDLNAIMRRPLPSRAAALLPALGRARYLGVRALSSLRSARNR